MGNNELFETQAIIKLINIYSDFDKKGTCIAWVTFPYNEDNLKIIGGIIKKLNWSRDEYTLSYDENLIFVKKDLM
ncbi:MAG: hypothetical protein HZC47_00260 [Methanobacterium sp.]|uniref:hypothetical protein n=1 Tax=Methanobacterium sp. TaxID=2164 RepID=UPI003D64C376|nr:hypothetical protein [Methanobacterium sp.]